jgi:polar amino acid transport system permease protein
MAQLIASEGARDQRWRAPSPPKDAMTFATGALAVALAVIAATLWVASSVRQVMAEAQVTSGRTDTLLAICTIAAFLLLLPGYKALVTARRSRAARLGGDIIAARVEGASARNWGWYTFGYAATVVLVLAIAMFIIANDVAVGRTFFFLPLIRDSFGLVLRAFWTNVLIFCAAEVLVLVWGLLVAIARLVPGKPGQPIRMIATAYTDVFRGLPAIITIYLVGFGLPLTGLPVVRDLPMVWYCVLALTLTYGAYVAEVYRAGIESIHWSQTAAARSLGLSFTQTLRFVIVPQAVRRIIPPLLNDFIGLQKDTALVNVIGAMDAFNQAKIVASNHFNLSSVTTVAFLFVLITIPQARFVDRLMERDQRRMRAAG